MTKKYLNARSTYKHRERRPYRVSESLSERLWIRRGMLWRTLAIHNMGLTFTEIKMVVEGSGNVFSDLVAMEKYNATVRDGNLWFAAKVTDGWKEVLEIEEHES